MALDENLSRSALYDKHVELEAKLGQEASWLVATLPEFESLWQVLTPRNRQRLVSAPIEEVVVDELVGEVTVRLTDLERGMGTDAPTGL